MYNNTVMETDKTNGQILIILREIKVTLLHNFPQKYINIKIII